MKKKLFTLLLCAFAWIGVNANEVSGTTWIIYGEGVEGKPSDGNLQSLTAPASSIETIKFVGSFPNGWDGTWFQDNGSVASKANITSIDLSEAILTGTTAGSPDANGSITASKGWGFSNFQNTALTITWPTAGNITVIPQYAFKKTALQEVTIPGYIKTICSHAFDSDSGDGFLKKIYFAEYDDPNTSATSDVQMAIGFQAFSNTYGLTDVYIQTHGLITAANNAFPHWDTYGHADPNRMLTALHFPDGEAEKYVNMNHKLTEAQASNNKLFQEWLVDHYSLAGSEGNGFYEFVQAGEDPDVNDVPWGDTFLRTYSHATLSHIVPPGAKAYIVNSISSDVSTKKVTVTLKRVNVIPAATGVIVFGGSNGVDADNNPVLRMMVVNYDGTPFDINNESGNKNYLTATANTLDQETYLQPYEKVSAGGKEFIYRSFIFTAFSNTDSGKKYAKAHNDTYGNGNYTLAATGKKGDWAGFFRAKKGNIGINKAYLHLDEDAYKDVDGGEIIIKVDDQNDPNSLGLTGEWYRLEFKDTNLTPFSDPELQAAGYWYKNNQWITWESKWGTRNVGDDYTFAKFSGELEDSEWMATLETLGISNVETKENKAEGFFNLQGMKVSQPTKGIYVKNGKKVIIK